LFKYLSVRFRVLAGHKVGSNEAADDLIQETSIAVLRKYKTEEFTKGFEHWAYEVLRMNIRKHYDRLKAEQKRFAEDSISSTSEGCSLNDPELERKLTACLKSIARKNRNYVRAIFLIYQGYKTDEICVKLNIDRTKLYVITSRGRAMLKACMNKGE
jgi:RNA polymerase sigma factor (sigma-70 family)